MQTILLMIVGLGVGFAFMGLGLLGIIVGKTLGASFHDTKSANEMDRKSRIYGLVWLLMGFLILITVIVNAHHAAAEGLKLGNIPAVAAFQ